MAVSDISDLDSVIVRVQRQLRGKRGEHYVSMNPLNGEISRPSWFGDRYIYRVITDSAGRPPGKGESNTIHISNDEWGAGANVTIIYQAICPEGNEVKLVKALGKYGNPSDELRTRITAVARGYLYNKADDLFANFGEVRQELLTFVCDTVQGETGLNIKAQLRVQSAEALSSYRFEEYIEVRFRDSQQQRTVFVQSDLDVVPKFTIGAIVSYHRLPALRARLIDIVKDYFRREVRAQAFAEQLRSPEIVNGLVHRFDQALARDGRCATSFTVAPSDAGSAPLPPLLFESEHQEMVVPVGRTEAIPLTSTVQLMLKDLAQFENAHVPDLEQWVHHTLHVIIREECFEKTYLQYLQGKSWATIASAIKDRMDTEANRIGYFVKHIISRPALKEYTYARTRQYRYKLTALPLKSTSPTYFDLTVDATFAISDWEDDGIAKKINQGVDLDYDITTELWHAAASVLVQHLPNDFILKFAEREAGRPSIEEQLVAAAVDTLENTYKAQAPIVTITPVGTPETARVQALLNVARDVDFAAKSLRGGQEIRFSLTWKISDIQNGSWDIIRRPDCNYTNIERELQQALSGSFSSLSDDELRFENDEEKTRLEARAQEAARMQIANSFGLIPTTYNLRCQPTSLESKVGTVQGTGIEASLDDELAAIEHTTKLNAAARSRQLAAIQRDDSVAEAVHRRIAELLSKPDRNDREDDELRSLQEVLDWTTGNIDAARSVGSLHVATMPKTTTKLLRETYLGRKQTAIRDGRQFGNASSSLPEAQTAAITVAEKAQGDVTMEKPE